LAKNPATLKMITKIGNNFPEKEEIVLSKTVIKINKRAKGQKRVLLMTTKALYNMKPKELGKCQRRIAIEKIVSVSTVEGGRDFSVHIPEEYDYHYISRDVDRIIEVLAEVYFKLSKETQALRVVKTDLEDLKSKTVSKDEARLLTREQRYQRYLDLVGSESFEDEVLDAKSGRKTVAILESDEKVTADSFEFLKVLGRGSFGKVMLVQKKDTEGIFAMKILKKKHLIDKHQVEHTKAERKILMSLQHPFLMQLRWAFQTDAKLYFILDFYKGGELFFHLKKMKRFSEEQARFFVSEVGLALGHLHSLDIIYRDLKPENILLDENGHICLTDFGLAKELGGDDLSKTFCGTPEYLAPEVIASVGHGKAVDWWSIGILLYELCVGIPPFYDQNVHSMYSKIQKAPLLIPSALSKEVKSVITKLLHRTPAKRLGSGPRDYEEIQEQPFFCEMDWDGLMAKSTIPPYIPKTKGTDDDVTNFDAAFLRQRPKDTHTAAPVLKDGDDGFSGFTFAPEAEGLGDDVEVDTFDIGKTEGALDVDDETGIPLEDEDYEDETEMASAATTLADGVATDFV
jgi:serum/glucocorticoid-regulated kinase 2